MPVYVELLLAKKRNSRLEEVYRQLERTTLEMFKTQNIETETLNIAPNRVAFMAFFINAIILSANVLKEHALVQSNQALIKEMLLSILKQSDSGNSMSQAERVDAPQPHNPRAEESKPHVPQPHPQQPHQRKQHHATPSPSTKERL